MPDEAWTRLAGLVRHRRIDCGLSQSQLAHDGGTTERTVRLIEKAERTSYRPATLRGIARALGWTPDSLDRILAGEDPVEAAHAATRPAIEDEVAYLKARVAELEAKVAEMLGARQPS